MPEALEKESLAASVDDALGEALSDVTALVRQYRLLSGFAESLSDTLDDPAHSPVVENVLTQLRAKLDALHPADVAHILEALPLDERSFIWDLVKADRDGDILVESSDAVRESLIATMETPELVAAAVSLDTDDLAELAQDLPTEVVAAVEQALPPEEREQLRQAMTYEEDMVGALMDFEMVEVRPDVSIEVVMRYLRRFDELPPNTDQVFVVDRENKLLGVLPTNTILVTQEDTLVGDVMVPAKISFEPMDHADGAAAAFERYDLLSAPVVDGHNMLIGRVTVTDVLEFVRASAEEDLLHQAGLREEEDVFAGVWKSVKNRWQWLALNLLTAFIASRATDLFQASIAKLAILAVLQSIVAGIGGNSGNQTLTMIARSIALGQLGTDQFRRLVKKELGVALINGLIFGGAIGLVIGVMEGRVGLGLVLTAAMTLNLMLAGLMGVVIPMWRHRQGKDPAAGSSVLLTAVTDTGGFFIFLGLATLFLIHG